MNRGVIVLVLIFSLCSANLFNISESVGVCSRKHYLQCDSRWANDQLPCGETICAVGCAMSSVAEALKSGFTPGTLNAWLKVHGGYEGCDLIWGTVDSLGMTFIEQTKHDETWMINHSQDCNYAIVINVRGGTHWVLVTGYAGNGNFNVNDPANFQSTYSYGDIVTASIYKYN